MKPKSTFAQSEIQDGDLICFQVDISEKETHDLESQGLYANPLHFYDFLQNRVMIIFRPKFEDLDDMNPEFDLVLSKKMNYDHVSSVLSPFRMYTYLDVFIDGGKSSRTAQSGSYQASIHDDCTNWPGKIHHQALTQSEHI